MPPLLNIPARTADLQASQRGAELILQWTAPGQTTEGIALKQVDRTSLLAKVVETGSVDAASFDTGARELATWNDLAGGQKVERHLPLPASPGVRLALAVKNFSARGRTLGVSNIAIVQIGPLVSPPPKLSATVQPAAIRLEWAPVSGAAGYRVYKRSGENPQFAYLGSTTAPLFEDSNFEWGEPYAYFVRAYAEVSTGIDESADSPVAAIVPHDVFPPSPPAGLRAVATETSAEISWNLSPEPDTAGYNIYRRVLSGSAPSPPVRLNAELLSAPVFSDKDVQRQRRYVYTVTAVDDKGNESGPSAPLEVAIP
ncbi:MAG TPA: fibronectin type III domain-containing protein [Bryobacterales bacterium]|jgi:hypothetical protein|nr:fibronectin type III domain-containing protein [Bryobacterales bacterium]